MNHNFWKVEKFDFDVVMQQPDGEITNKCYTASSKKGAIEKAQVEFPENEVLEAIPI